MKRKLLIFLIYILPLCLLMKIDVVSSAVRNNLTHTSNLGVDASNKMWNQAIHSNNRGSGNEGADVNYSNCYALAQRCAKPKCKTGCNDISLAGSIVNGCMNGMDNCSEYTDKIIESLSAELVANANAKMEAQPSSDNNEQLIELQNQMQQLSMQTQQAIAEANARAEAAENANLSANTYENTETSVQSNNTNDDELRSRASLSGQIFTNLDNIQTGLAKTKKALSAFYSYAGCNTSGENCKAPKRVSAMKEKAEQFLDAYDETRLAVYNALLSAQTAGVDIEDIYRLLSDSCEQWGIYKKYNDSTKESELYKILKPQEDEYDDDLLDPGRYIESLSCNSKKSDDKNNENTTTHSCGYTMELQCVSKNISRSNSFFKGLSVGSQDILSIDMLRDILSADYNPLKKDINNIESESAKICGGNTQALKTFLSSKTNNLQKLLTPSTVSNCKNNIKSIKCNDDINPNLAICSTHIYNISETENKGTSNVQMSTTPNGEITLKTPAIKLPYIQGLTNPSMTTQQLGDTLKKSNSKFLKERGLI